MSTRLRNFVLGVGLTGFVGSVYMYTFKKVGTVRSCIAMTLARERGVTLRWFAGSRTRWVVCGVWGGVCCAGEQDDVDVVSSEMEKSRPARPAPAAAPAAPTKAQ
jgi:hypothetical protein